MHDSHTLKEYHGKRCPYCARPMSSAGPRNLTPTRDHYPIPKSRGGKRTIICCFTCNHIKSDRSAEEWAAFMLENKGGWFNDRPADAAMPAHPPAPAPQMIGKPLPIAHTKYILLHGTKAYRKWEAAGFPADGQASGQ